MNESDSALGISQMLMKGIRFGKLTADKQSEREAQIFQNIKNVAFINVKGVKGFVGHGHFREYPGALSDIITLIKTGSPPGTPIRPLKRVENNFWSLEKVILGCRRVYSLIKAVQRAPVALRQTSISGRCQSEPLL